MRPVRYSLISANVGEWTRSLAPRPAATPRTNCVLPAPRSPLSPTIIPALARSPKARPSATVSSGLLEMCVAMNEEGFDALFVAQMNAWFSGDFSDARELHGRESFFPFISQLHRVFACDGKEQFKILAVG